VVTVEIKIKTKYTGDDDENLATSNMQTEGFWECEAGTLEFVKLVHNSRHIVQRIRPLLCLDLTTLSWFS